MGLVRARSGFYDRALREAIGILAARDARSTHPKPLIAFWGANVPVKDIDWRQLGACRGLDPGIFYPETDDESESAKLVCAACGVRTACLEHALQRREKQGVWGGSTERERRRIIRQRRRSA